MSECERATGWVYCAHSIEELTVCSCSCTCRDQTHCPRLLSGDLGRQDAKFHALLEAVDE